MTVPIRIAHISDSHLGYRALTKLDPATERNQRTVDIEHAFTRTIDDIIKRRPDGVIHSGDLFQHARPTWQSMRHFIRQFRRLEEAGIPALVIAGNHDTPRIRTGGSAYSVLELALPNVKFHAGYEDVNDLETFESLGLHIHAVPHGALTNPDPVSPFTVPDRINVLVVHGMAPGVAPTSLAAEPGEQILSQHLLDEAYDYIALGHVHESQQAVTNGWYAGSAERLGWGDAKVVPGYLMVSLTEPGAPVAIEHIDLPSRPMIAIPPIEGADREATVILEEIIGSANNLEQPTAIVRADLRTVGRNVRREVQRLLRRAEVNVWHLDLAAERDVFLHPSEAAGDDEADLDLHALFREFVEARKANHPNPEFTATFLDRGSRALTEAQLAEADARPEDDVRE